MACVSSALIVGGGIAGLAAAVALARVGVHCEVVEQSASQQGASLGFSGRAAMALVELGVYDEVRDANRTFGEGSTATQIRDAAGTLINAGPKRPTWPGAVENVAVYRPTFIEIMAKAARDLGVTIHTGVTTQTIENSDEGVAVTFTDGRTGHYDMLIGCDGIGSKTRAAIFPEAPKPTYSGQFSIRWMAEGPPIEPEGWYLGPLGRVGMYYLPQGMVYMPAVIIVPEMKWFSDEEVRAHLERLLDSYTAPSVIALRERLSPQSNVWARPFEWLLVPDRWHRGSVLLIGDAAHATTAHMGMGGGMALEDAAVLGQCISAASTLPEALAAFMARRFDRVKLVVETSVQLSRLEQEKAPESENVALLTRAFQTLGQPY